MEKKTQLETLVSLRNDQLELVLNRRASIRLLKKLMDKDPNRVLTVTMDQETFQPKPITVTARLKEMEVTAEMEEARLTEYDIMIEELETAKVEGKHSTELEH